MCSDFQSLFGESVVWDDDTIFYYMDLRVAVLPFLLNAELFDKINLDHVFSFTILNFINFSFLQNGERIYSKLADSLYSEIITKNLNETIPSLFNYFFRQISNW